MVVCSTSALPKFHWPTCGYENSLISQSGVWAKTLGTERSEKRRDEGNRWGIQPVPVSSDWVTFRAWIWSLYPELQLLCRAATREHLDFFPFLILLFNLSFNRFLCWLCLLGYWMGAIQNQKFATCQTYFGITLNVLFQWIFTIPFVWMHLFTLSKFHIS